MLNCCKGKSRPASLKTINRLYVVVLFALKHQGSTAEKSSAQKLNQGAWKNVLNIIFP
jgi:hypothetical protein